MRQKNLLIVDDEKLLAQNLKYLTSKFANKIYLAHNGNEALEILKTHEIHCVICDITMPVMNGMELIREVRTLGMDVPFVFYTANNQNDYLTEAKKYGIKHFLKKPDFSNLETVIRSYLVP